MIDPLLEALQARFAGDVPVLDVVPATPKAPAIIVAPGDPFLSPSTHGLIVERWEVLAVVNVTAGNRAPSVSQMRRLSLKVRAAAGDVGAVWVRANRPRWATEDERGTAVVPNLIEYRYQPTAIEPPTLEGST